MGKLKLDEGPLRRAEFADLNGNTCSIQESSLASEDGLWLGVEVLNGAYGYTEKPVRMLLNRDAVAAVIPLLEVFVKTGRLDQGEAGPSD